MIESNSMGEVDRWTNLPPDLLNEIAKRMYSCDDYVRLRHTCRQWNLLLPQTPNHRNPWLVVPFDHETCNSHGLDEKEIYHLRLPDIKNNFFRGSSYGYLIIVMASGALRMLNPFNKSQYDLPPISSFPNIVAYDPDEEEYTIRDFKIGGTHTLKKSYLHKIHLEKIITSSPPNHEDFMAVAIYSGYDRLAYCKLGDRRWLDIPHERIACGFQDVTFHEGKIYAIEGSGRLSEFDVKTRDPLRGFEIAITLPQGLVPYANMRHTYLISCPNGGGLLMAVRNLFRGQYVSVGKCCFWTHKFDLFILNNDTKQPTWSRTNSLGNYAIVLGYNSSTWMLPDASSNNRKGNQIYYTDNQPQNHGLERIGDLDIIEHVGGHDIGVLDLEDGTINRPFPNSSLVYPPPVWLLAEDVP